MLPSLRDVLASDTVRSADPQILSGADRLARGVRWVHVSEVPDVSGLLQGGELLLSTGLAMRGDAAAEAYVRALVDAGAAGLIVELGEGFPTVPEPALAVAREAGFPVVALRRKTQFVAITEEVHRAIVAEQYAHVAFAQRVHEEFTALSLDNAPAQQIVEATAALADASVVLEDLARHVVAYSAHGRPSAGLLRDWQRRSRLAPLRADSGISGPEGWMTSPVGVSGSGWGRLVIANPTSSQERLSMLLERAAQALELGRMVERDRIGVEYQAQGGLVADLVAGRVDEAEARVRADSLGLAAAPAYVAVVVHRRPPRDGAGDPMAAQRRGRRFVERVAEVVRTAPLSALVAMLEPDQVALLLTVPHHRGGAGHAEDKVLRALSEAVHTAAVKQDILAGVTLGVGRSAPTLVATAASIRVAQHVAEVASTMPAPSDRAPHPYYRNTDVRLRGLVALLHDDPRVQAFAETELDRLLLHEATHGAGLVDLLRQYLEVGGNKTELARVSHRSRPALYKKLEQIERILGVPLDDPASMLSLGVAMLVHDHAQR